MAFQYMLGTNSNLEVSLSISKQREERFTLIKGEYFVQQVAMGNREELSDRHKIHNIFNF